MAFLKRNYLIYIMVFSLVVGAAARLGRVERSVETVTSDRGPRIVVIDPGHGGEDGGAVSVTGKRESDLNLEISLRLRDLLGLLGVPVVMVRTEDVSVWENEAASLAEKKVSDLKHRVRLVEEIPDSLLLSIHQNFFTQEKYAGAQVFYAATESSQALAEALQQVLDTQVDPSNHRSCKPSQGVYLMEKITCPGILVECGFLSNAAEEARLHTADYQKLLVSAIGACTVNFLTEELKKHEV